jgi:hypothetical protein
MRKMLGKDFFDQPTLTVARELIGKYLVRRRGGKTIACMITETEAYDGARDLACKARSGKTAVSSCRGNTSNVRLASASPMQASGPKNRGALFIVLQPVVRRTRRP